MNDNQQQIHEERYAADLTALAECIAKGVSDKSVQQLAAECAVDRRDLNKLLNIKEVA